MIRTFCRRHAFVRRSLAALALLPLLAGLEAAATVSVYRDATVPGDTDWFTAGNWFDATTSTDAYLPTAADDVYIGDTGHLSPAAVDIAAAGAAAGNLTVGNDAGSSGTLNLLTGGGLSVGNFLTVGGDGTGILNQSGGALQTYGLIVQDTLSQTGGLATATFASAANWRGGEAHQTLGPGGTFNTGFTYVGAASFFSPDTPGSGRFDQTGGTHAVLTSLTDGGDHGLYVGFWTGGTGAYFLSGADALLQTPSTVVGFAGGNGTVTQTAGTHLITSDSALPGAYAPGLFLGFGVHETEEDVWVGTPSTGAYALTGGTLTITRAPEAHGFGAVVWLASAGTGTLLLGDANGTGTLNETNPPALIGTEVGVSLYLRPFPSGDADGTATVRGWGTTGLTGTLFNNGRVIADGYGQDRDLDLTSFSVVTSDAGIDDRRSFPQVDGTQPGWYVQNHGRLLLPTHTMDLGAGDYTVLWGTSPIGPIGTAFPVNSLAIRFNVLAEPPPGFSIALLAADRDDVPAGTTGAILGLWDISPDTPLPEGVAPDLAIRYDDLLADAFIAGAPSTYDELALQLYHFDGAQWAPLAATSVDPVNHLILCSDVSSFSLFALGWNITNAIPEPATCLLLGLSALGLLPRRHARRRG